MAMTLACLALPRTTVAAPTPGQKAESALKEGLGLDKAGKAEAALTKFEESYALVPTAAAAYQIARVEAALGRYTVALLHYREALRDPKLSIEARREAEAALENLKTKIGILSLDIPEGATATIDGNEVDPKHPAEVMPGLRVVKIHLGGDTRTADVTATAGSVTPVKLRFEAAPSPPPPPRVTPPKDTSTRWPSLKLGVVGGGAAVGVGLLATSLIIALGAGDGVRAPSPTACADRAAPGCNDFADARDSQESARTSASICFYSGLIVGAATAVAAVLWPNERVTASAQLSSRSRATFSGFTLRF